MGLFKDNETTIQLENDMVIKESQLIGGKPVGYFTDIAKGLHSDYREQIQQVARAGLELGASRLQAQDGYSRSQVTGMIKGIFGFEIFNSRISLGRKIW